MITLNPSHQPTTTLPPERQRFGFNAAIRLLKAARRFVARRPAISLAGEVEPLFWDRHAAFDIALAAVNQGEWALAERELTNGNGHRALSDARCLNLLGVVFEATERWGLARQCYSRAIRADRHFQAPRVNIKRFYELSTLGRTRIAVCLGDEKGLQS